MKDSEKLLEIVQGHAPRSAKARMGALHDIAVNDGMSEDEICCMWAGVLLDGLRYGNWPWVIEAQLGR